MHKSCTLLNFKGEFAFTKTLRFNDKRQINTGFSTMRLASDLNSLQKYCSCVVFNQLGICTTQFNGNSHHSVAISAPNDVFNFSLTYLSKACFFHLWKKGTSASVDRLFLHVRLLHFSNTWTLWSDCVFVEQEALMTPGIFVEAYQT